MKKFNIQLMFFVCATFTPFWGAKATDDSLELIRVECPEVVFSGEQLEVVLRSQLEVKDFRWAVEWKGSVLKSGRIVLRPDSPESLRIEVPNATVPVSLSLQLGSEVRTLEVIPENVLDAYRGEWRKGPPDVWDPRGHLLSFLREKKIDVHEVKRVEDIRATRILVTELSHAQQSALSASLPDLLKRGKRLYVFSGGKLRFPSEPLFSGSPAMEWIPDPLGKGFELKQMKGEMWLLHAASEDSGWSRLHVRSPSGEFHLYSHAWPASTQVSARDIYFLNNALRPHSP
jgi:hypothetical protein